jgi:hypothetical protein
VGLVPSLIFSRTRPIRARSGGGSVLLFVLLGLEPFSKPTMQGYAKRRRQLNMRELRHNFVEARLQDFDWRLTPSRRRII